MKKPVLLNNKTLGDDQTLFLLAGPCVIEDDLSITYSTAEKLKEITSKLGITLIFKSSFDKANRTSINSFRGPGLIKGLAVLEKVKKEYELPIVTDIHEPSQADSVAEVADILQIPAFLSRQTDVIVAAAKTGKIVNIKKGQFLSPEQVIKSAQKSVATGNENVLLTERGVFFGYGNLVVDMKAIPLMQSYGHPVVFDGTHSVQLPGGAGDYTAGQREYVKTLVLSAIAAGADGLFLEVHPDPDNAPCDGPNMLPLNQLEDVLKRALDIFHAVRKK